MAEVGIANFAPQFDLPKTAKDFQVAYATGEEWRSSPGRRGRKLKYKRPEPGVVTLCRICGIESPPHASFHVHLVPFNQEKPFACNLCSTSFGRKQYLDVHLRTHTGERPYECMQCHKRFTQKSSLNTHKKVHSGERPFSCGQCYKRFTQKSSLNTHMKVHTGERPYSCEVCHKSFALKSYVTAHRWSHVSKDELACTVCNNAVFTSKTLLVAHMRTHSSGGQQHRCGVCGRRFLRTGYLARHTAQAHGAVLEVTPTIQVEEGRVHLSGDFEGGVDYDASTDDGDV